MAKQNIICIIIFKMHIIKTRIYTILGGDNMINSVRETRFKSKGGSYLSILEIAEEEFFKRFDRVDSEIASEIVSRYLIECQDDARADNIEIKHDKDSQIISIQCRLNYIGNDHTDYSS